MPTPPDFSVGQYNTAAYMNSIGLWLIKSQAISTSPAVTSVTVSDVFSSSFDAYQIVVSGGATTGGDYGINLRLGSTTSGYYYTGEYRNFSNTVNNVISAAPGAEWGAVGIATTNSLQLNAFVNQPFLAKPSYFSAMYIYGHPVGGQASMAGFLDNSTSYTGFTLFINASSFSGGTIRVYGYRK